MRNGIKIRLVAFVILSATGMLYVGANYLGLVDKFLGRGYTVHVLLPGSGGLFEGSEVSYRGVRVGKVEKMSVENRGLRVDVSLEDKVRIPAGSPVFVHNLSAVGEQYLDFEPSSKQGPSLKDGDTVRGTTDSLPLGEDVLLTDLDRFVSNLDGKKLNTTITELGAMFGDNATSLRSIVDNTQKFVETARDNEDVTVDLLNNLKPVLQTQVDNSANIRSFASDLAAVTGTLAKSDGDIRKILTRAGPSADELVRLVRTLRPVLPPLLTHLTSIAKVADTRLAGLEQLLVTLPRQVSTGPSATSEGPQKYGRVNLNLNETVYQTPAPCTAGYIPPGQWRPTSDESFVDLGKGGLYAPTFDVKCASDPPINVRGMKHAPPLADLNSVLDGSSK